MCVYLKNLCNRNRGCVVTFLLTLFALGLCINHSDDIQEISFSCIKYFCAKKVCIKINMNPQEQER